jgi:hypothetical protein
MRTFSLLLDRFRSRCADWTAYKPVWVSHGSECCVKRSTQNPLVAGQEALGRGAWEEARAAFEVALGAGKTAEGLEGLGMAAVWLDDGAGAIGARGKVARASACAVRQGISLGFRRQGGGI